MVETQVSRWKKKEEDGNEVSPEALIMRYYMLRNGSSYLLKAVVENVVSSGTCHYTKQGTNSTPAEINYKENKPF